MRYLLAILVALLPSGVFAHVASVAHEHPHAHSHLAGVEWLGIAAIFAALSGLAILRRWRSRS